MLRLWPRIIEVLFFVAVLDFPYMIDLPLMYLEWYSLYLSLVSEQQRIDLSSTELMRLVSLMGTFRPWVLRVEIDKRFSVEIFV